MALFGVSRKNWREVLDQDIRNHIELETQDNLDRGMDPDEARQAALRKFGNITRIQEDTRAVWRSIWFDQLLQDARYALRSIRRQPGFTALVVITLALGIGMNTAVVSVLNTVLLRPLPYPDSNRLVWLANYNLKFKNDNYVARADYLAWKQHASSFESMTAYGTQDLSLVSGGEASQERIVSVTGEFWKITGAQPMLGRLPQPGETGRVTLSWALFERRFGADTRLIGKTVLLNGSPFTVAGVLPKAFRLLFPQQVAPGDEVRDIDAYIPIPDVLMTMPPANAREWDEATKQFGPVPFWLLVIGKLRGDVPVPAARAEMQTIYTRNVQQNPGVLRESRILRFVALQEKLAGNARRPLMVLLLAVAMVLLIACANVANLLLSRATTRQREIAIRTAVGAGRSRVIRQFLVESILLALLGGLAGLILGYCAIVAISRLWPDAVPRMSESGIDRPVLAFTIGISLLSGLLFGMAPLMTALRPAVFDVLKAETGTSSAAAGRVRLRAFLSACELALAIILLAGAGLLFKSFWRMNERPAGFEPEKILVMRITLSGPRYATWPPKQAYTDQLLQALQSLPGAQAAGVDAGSMNSTVRVDGNNAASPEEGMFASIRGVSPGYLRTVGVPLLRGEWPPATSLFGAVVNETFARQIGGDVIGRRLGGSILSDTITGVVADFKTQQLDADALPEVYIRYERLPITRSMRVLVRTTTSASAFAPAVRQRIGEIDRSQAVFEFQTLEKALAASIVPRQFTLFLLAVFAATALVLALIGTYGVIAYSVSLRMREIGIRLALGASRREILAMVLRQGAALAGTGIVAGVPAGLALTRMMASLLYVVKPDDPWIFAAATATLAITALLAAMGPAMLAARVEPVTALRHE